MTVRFTIAAQLELEEAREWYEARSAGLGNRFTEAVHDALERIETMPNAWQRLGSNARRYSLKDFPYGVAYQVNSDGIVIIAVGHLRRRPTYWNKRLRSPKP
ncbi:MAG: type II toxin-antitoxin system RelE/ParE family toxin [Hyphomicrobiaceae bacterium]